MTTKAEIARAAKISTWFPSVMQRLSDALSAADIDFCVVGPLALRYYNVDTRDIPLSNVNSQCIEICVDRRQFTRAMEVLQHLSEWPYWARFVADTSGGASSVMVDNGCGRCAMSLLTSCVPMDAREMARRTGADPDVVGVKLWPSDCFYGFDLAAADDDAPAASASASCAMRPGAVRQRLPSGEAVSPHYSEKILRDRGLETPLLLREADVTTWPFPRLGFLLVAYAQWFLEARVMGAPQQVVERVERVIRLLIDRMGLDEDWYEDNVADRPLGNGDVRDDIELLHYEGDPFDGEDANSSSESEDAGSEVAFEVPRKWLNSIEAAKQEIRDTLLEFIKNRSDWAGPCARLSEAELEAVRRIPGSGFCQQVV